MFKFLIVSICFIHFSYSQVKDLAPIFPANPFDLSEVTFLTKWKDRCKASWYASVKMAEIKNAKAFGISADLVSLTFGENKKLRYIRLSYNNATGSQKSYRYVADKGFEIFKTLKKKYGKPLSYTLLDDQRVLVDWKDKDINIFLSVKAVDSLVPYSNVAILNFTKEPGHIFIKKPVLPKGVYRAFQNNVRQVCNENLPNAKTVNSLATLLNKKWARPVSTTGDRELFCNYAVAKDLLLDPLNNLKFHNFHIRSFVKEKPLNRDFFKLKIKGDKLLEAEYISSNELGVEKSEMKTFFIYDQEKALKLIIKQFADRIEHYWINYDEKGYCSGVYHFKNFQPVNYYFIYSENRYKSRISAHYSYEYSKFMKFAYFLGDEEVELGFDEIYKRQIVNKSSENFSIQNRLALEENKIKYFLPNLNVKNEYKPKDAVNSYYMLESLDFLRTCKEALLKRNTQNKTKIKELMNGLGNPFDKLNYKGAFVSNFRTESLPFVVNKTAERAIQLKLNNGKLFTLFLNKVAYKRYQLIKIEKERATFKDLVSNQSFTMNILQPYNKAVVSVDYKGVRHDVKEGENFFGYTFGQASGKLIFTGKGKALNVNKHLLDFEPEKEGGHKIYNCPCDSNSLSLEEIMKLKKSRIDWSFLLKNMNFSLTRQTIIPRENGQSYSYSKISNWTIENNRLVKLKSFEKSEEDKYKLSLRGNRFYLGNKAFVAEPSNVLHRRYKISLSKTEKVQLEFTPKNAYVFEKLINQFYIQIDTDKSFKSFNLRENRSYDEGVEGKVKYSIKPEANEITLNGEIYRLDFISGDVYIFDPEMLKGFKISPYRGFPHKSK